MFILFFILFIFLFNYYILINCVRKTCIKYKITKKNYRGKDIPHILGSIFILNSLICIFITIIFYYFSLIEENLYKKLLVFFFTSLNISLIGLLDDLFGDNKNKGFKGHINALIINKKLTTGFLKMILIPASLIPFALYNEHSLIMIVIKILLTSLLINLSNLFDLRPGRCIKFFIVQIILLLPFINIDLIFLFVFIMSIALIIGDLKEEFMLGDSGSNVFGFYSAFIFFHNIHISLLTSTIILLFTFILNLLSEKYSFTQIIEKNKLLNFIDMIGRKK